MKEIKFRAWDTKDNVMIDADSFYFSDEFEPFVDSVKKAQNRFKIMQYTGLKDKNGKEVYEGDIVYWEHLDSSGVVYYNEDEVHYFVKPLNDFNESESYLDNTHMEVISNIHENPEIL